MDHSKIKRPINEDFDDDEEFIRSIEKKYAKPSRPAPTPIAGRPLTQPKGITREEVYEIARQVATEVCEEMLTQFEPTPSQTFDMTTANTLAELIASKLGGAPRGVAAVVNEQPYAAPEEKVYDDPENPYSDEENIDPFKEEAMRLAGKSTTSASADSWRSALTALPESQGSLDISAITGL